MQLKDLLGGLKWVFIGLVTLCALIGSWVGIAWLIGRILTTLFHLTLFPDQFISFGSCVLVFTSVVQIVTVLFTMWFLISWGKAKVKKAVTPNV